jgi:hypothetical protein
MRSRSLLVGKKLRSGLSRSGDRDSDVPSEQELERRFMSLA